MFFRAVLNAARSQQDPFERAKGVALDVLSIADLDLPAADLEADWRELRRRLKRVSLALPDRSPGFELTGDPPVTDDECLATIGALVSFAFEYLVEVGRTPPPSRSSSRLS